MMQHQHRDTLDSLTLYEGSLPSAVNISLMSVVARRVSSAMLPLLLDGLRGCYSNA